MSSLVVVVSSGCCVVVRSVGLVVLKQAVFSISVRVGERELMDSFRGRFGEKINLRLI